MGKKNLTDIFKKRNNKNFFFENKKWRKILKFFCQKKVEIENDRKAEERTFLLHFLAKVL